MFTPEDKQLIETQFNRLLSLCDSNSIYKHEGDRERIIEAFNFANEAHYGVRRKSGEPYIMHPIAVAVIAVEEIGLGVKSLLAALLHDVVEDTDYSVDDIASRFGEKVASMVDGLTKMKIASDLAGDKEEISEQAENFKKILLTLSNDVRVIIIKLADRLHNMRTLGSMANRKQLKILSETMYLYAPLAHRLGLYAIKSELEDLSLKYSHPTEYKYIKDTLLHNEEQLSTYISRLIEPIEAQLVKAGVEHEIKGRIKSIYSIWKKMQQKRISIDEVYDLFAIRIVFKSVDYLPEKTQVWHIYSMVTDIYTPKPDRLREWINIPKANGYEALHCTVMGPDGRWAEVQIRSQRMDDIAEKGFAAHWKYKDRVEVDSELDKWVREVRIALNSPTNNAIEFLDEFQLNLYQSEIVVFTPKGDTKILPQGATALDLAYDIHTNVGNKAIGAKINHKTESIFHELNSGDQVEIITSNSASPKVIWLRNVMSAKAKACIKSYLKKQSDNVVSYGIELYELELNKCGITPSSSFMNKVLTAYNCTNKEEFYSKVGAGLIELSNLKKVVLSHHVPTRFWTLKIGNPFKKREHNKHEQGSDNQELQYVIAECCFPTPGDDVVGVKDSRRGVVEVHKKSCPLFLKTAAQNSSAIVTTRWSSEKILSYLSHITISGSDRVGILLDISTLLSKQLNINIRKINIESGNGSFEGIISLYVKNYDDLMSIIFKLSKIKGVDTVEKLTE